MKAKRERESEKKFFDLLTIFLFSSILLVINNIRLFSQAKQYTRIHFDYYYISSNNTMGKTNLHHPISWENTQQQQQQQQQSADYYTTMPSNQKEIYPWMNDKTKTNKKTSSTSTSGKRFLTMINECIIIHRVELII